MVNLRSRRPLFLSFSLAVAVSCRAARDESSPSEETVPSEIVTAETRSSELASGFDGSKVRGFTDRISLELEGGDTTRLETIRQGIKSALCSLAKSPAGDALKNIDGVALQGKVDLVNILAGGASPVSVFGGIEAALFFTEDPELLDLRVFAVPGASVQVDSSPAWPPVNLETGVIYGCGGDPDAFSGYFASIAAGGVSLNLGASAEAVFEKAFLEGMPSTVPGSINDNHAIEFEKVKQVVADNGAALRAILDERKAGALADPPYAWASHLNSDHAMTQVLQEVPLTLLGNETWKTDLDTIVRRTFQVIEAMVDADGVNHVTERLESSESLGRREGESEVAFALRAPTLLPKFTETMRFFWGNPDSESSLEHPDGLGQTLFAAVGHGYGMNYNRRRFDVALNPDAASTDGPWLGSVSDELARNVKATMLTDESYGCTRQRARYPGHRWFVVYVNDQKHYFDCYGFGADETYSEGVSHRLYDESDFAAIQAEMTTIRRVFDLLEELRYAAHHGAIQIHDAFYTKQVLRTMKTGGIRTSDVLTRCNSFTADAKALASPSVIAAGAAAATADALVKELRGAATLTTAALLAAKTGRASASLTHYYEVYRQRIPGGALSRAVAELRGESCDD